MGRLDEVTFIKRKIEIDQRGWFLKVIEGKEKRLPTYTGEVYLVTAVPGQVRGNHYHLCTSEWFTVVIGQAQLVICDPVTGEQQEYFLDQARPTTVYIPAGIGHAFQNPDDSREIMLLAVYADRLYDPSDTIHLDLL